MEERMLKIIKINTTFILFSFIIFLNFIIADLTLLITATTQRSYLSR